MYSKRTLKLLFLWLGTCLGQARADLISFDTSQWNHGSGSQVGWNDGEFSGTTNFLGRQLTVTTSQVGTAQFTGDHFSRINETFFSGFAFQNDPNTTNNSADFANGTLQNYSRMDFSFNGQVRLDEYILTDVDRVDGQWWDIVAAESFDTSAPGAVGTGTSATYSTSPVTNIISGGIYGLNAATAAPGTGNVQNTPENDVFINFGTTFRSFSIYYWNLTPADSGASTQTIGTRGNNFQVSAAPEPGAGISASIAMLLVGLLIRRRRPLLVVRVGQVVLTGAHDISKPWHIADERCPNERVHRLR